MKVRKILKTVLPLLLVALLFLVCAFYPVRREEETARRVVRVWNVDTFEGGTGSRTAFLKSVARRAEAKSGGVYYLVLSLTAEGAKQAFSEGDQPDILSFGTGLSEFAERSLPLPYSFRGGELGGKTLAYPWCAGGYYLFSLTDDFGAAGKTAISCGGKNLPQVAASLGGISGEELPSLTAYTAFLQGSYRYLLGTQRDICRFRARGVAVYSKRLSAFSDLYQYISVLSAEKREDCFTFLAELLSDETQRKVGELGMFSLQESPASSTTGAFLSEEGAASLLGAARDGKNLEKFLKSI